VSARSVIPPSLWPSGAPSAGGRCYDARFNLGLTDPEKNDLVEYLKSL
jgi:hypothetical protein